MRCELAISATTISNDIAVHSCCHAATAARIIKGTHNSGVRAIMYGSGIRASRPAGSALKVVHNSAMIATALRIVVMEVPFEI